MELSRKEQRELVSAMAQSAGLNLVDTFKLRVICRRDEAVMAELVDAVQVGAAAAYGSAGIFANLIQWVIDNPDKVFAIIQIILMLI